MRTRLRPVTRRPTNSHMRRICRLRPSVRTKRNCSGLAHATLAGRKLATIQLQSVVQQGQASRVKDAVDPHQIFLFDLRIVTNQLTRNAAILRQHQKTGGINIESSGRCHTFEHRWLKALCVSVRLRLCRNQAYGRLMSILGLAGNEADRLVQQHCRLFGLVGTCLGCQRNHGVGGGAGAEFGDPFAIDEDQAALNVGVCFAAGTQTAFSQKFGNPNTLRIIHGH
jgi:hypothetical protein